MFTTLRRIVSRNEATLLQDMIGALSLVIILVAGLHLPSF